MAFILFNQMTTLDLTGFHNTVTWLKKRHIVDELQWDFCSNQQTIIDDRDMRIQVDNILPDLSSYDLIFIPGGPGTREWIHDESFVSWIRTAAPVPFKVSVCTGALLLGAAGFTRDKVITTNPLALHELQPFCKEVVKARTLRDGDVITGGGITAAIDLGLYVAELISGPEAVQEITRYMDYPYYNS
jgi:transcriptional regulator GlxA family with amidase domain